MMCLHGLKKKSLKSRQIPLILFFIFVNSLYAQDMGQTLSGQEVDNATEKMEINEESAHWIPGRKAKKFTNEEEVAAPTVGLPDNVKGKVDKLETTQKDEFRSGIKPYGLYKDPGYFSELDTSKRLEKYKSAGKNNLYITYLMDNYNYDSPGNSYTKTFETDSAGSYQLGYLHIKNDYFLSRGMTDLYLNFGVGVGYSKGYAHFSDGSANSDAVLKFWTVPVDFGVGGSLNMTRFLRISGNIGGTVMGVFQNRSDRGYYDVDRDGKKSKLIKDFGYGPYAEIILGIGLGSIFTSKGSSLLAKQSITKYNLNLIGRYQSASLYKNSNVTISGFSLGAGISFEYF